MFDPIDWWPVLGVLGASWAVLAGHLRLEECRRRHPSARNHKQPPRHRGAPQ